MNLIHKIYFKFFVKDGFAYANYLKKRGSLHSQGNNCYISMEAHITDPYLTSIGDNVWITHGCKLFCHDASVIMINILLHGHLDRVGPITIGDNCFLGNNVIILPHITIGNKTIIGTGSVVTKDIPGEAVWAGNPARFICSFENYIQKITTTTNSYPWCDLLKKNDTHIYDPELEMKLRQERVHHFFSSKK